MVNDVRTRRGTGSCVGAFIWPRTVLHARSSKLGKVETRVENAGAVRTSPSQQMVGLRRASCVAILWCRWPTVSDAFVVIKCSEPSNNLTVSVTRSVDGADFASIFHDGPTKADEFSYYPTPLHPHSSLFGARAMPLLLKERRGVHSTGSKGRIVFEKVKGLGVPFRMQVHVLLIRASCGNGVQRPFT